MRRIFSMVLILGVPFLATCGVVGPEGIAGTFRLTGCANGAPLPCVTEGSSGAFTLVDSGRVVLTASGEIQWLIFHRFSNFGTITSITDDFAGTYASTDGGVVEVTLQPRSGSIRVEQLIWNQKDRLIWPKGKEPPVFTRR